MSKLKCPVVESFGEDSIEFGQLVQDIITMQSLSRANFIESNKHSSVSSIYCSIQAILERCLDLLKKFEPLQIQVEILNPQYHLWNLWMGAAFELFLNQFYTNDTNKFGRIHAIISKCGLLLPVFLDKNSCFENRIAHYTKRMRLTAHSQSAWAKCKIEQRGTMQVLSVPTSSNAIAEINMLDRPSYEIVGAVYELGTDIAESNCLALKRIIEQYITKLEHFAPLESLKSYCIWVFQHRKINIHHLCDLFTRIFQFITDNKSTVFFPRLWIGSVPIPQFSPSELHFLEQTAGFMVVD
jgi:hypothetical protein